MSALILNPSHHPARAAAGDQLVPEPAVQTHPKFEPGDLIDGQYRVERRHQGGMGVVYLCVDEATGKRFALKGVLPSPDHTSKSFADHVGRFEREAVVWVNLGPHPHVVQALAYRQQATPPYLLLEFIDGPSMAEVLKRVGRIEPAQAVAWARQAAAGMHHAHTFRFPNGQTGVPHRDIKPANLLLTRKGELKISDFGLVKLEDGRELSISGKFVGTILYSSPEQLLSSKHAGLASDLFSFGIVFYEMLAGRRPFDGDSSHEVIQAIQFREPDWSPIPTTLRPVLVRCLHKSPAGRFSSFDELNKALAALEPTLPAISKGIQCTCCHFPRVTTEPCPVCGESLENSAVDRFHMANTVIDSNPAGSKPSGSSSSHCACGEPIVSGTSFCRRCGNQLPVSRCECGSWNPPTNSFCSRCGARLAKSAPQ
jgi:serine/threonine protein kinase